MKDFFHTDELLNREEINQLISELETIKIYLPVDIHEELESIISMLKDDGLIAIEIQGKYCDDSCVEIYETYKKRKQNNEIYLIPETIVEELQFIGISHKLKLLSNLDPYSDHYYNNDQLQSLIIELKFIYTQESNNSIRIIISQLLNIFNIVVGKGDEYGILFY